MDAAPLDYPAQWEADVVLRDGGTAHIRPITPGDEDALAAFHRRQSAESVYFRFFAPYPELTQRDLDRFTHVDHVDRVALVALVGEDIIGVVRYDRIDDASAEVAFNIADAHQGRGLGSVLLEHVAQAARERGVRRFVADVLPTNRKMLSVFSDAGYEVKHRYDDGVISLGFDIAPTDGSRAVMAAREHRAESVSVRRLLSPRSVAVVGAGRDETSLGRTLLRAVVAGGFTGSVYAVNPHATGEIDGVPVFPRTVDIPADVDLALVAVPADAVEAVVTDCAHKGVRGLVVVSAGFAETGADGRARQQHLVRLARSNGMRVVGPNSFGLVNTDPEVALNATLAPRLPAAGRVGFFSQSGALGIALLEAAAARGLGLSTFVSAGNRADVSGNDLLQYWEEDPATDVVMLYLESIGNPRKFSRLARRVTRSKPVVAVKSGRTTQSVPIGHSVRPSQVPPHAVDAMFRQAGVVQVENIHQLFDVATLLANQPLPSGPRVAVVGNSDALGLLAADAAASWDLEVVGTPIDLGAEATADDFAVALDRVFGDPGVDSVIAVFIPPRTTPDEDVARMLADAAARTPKTVVSTLLGMRGAPEILRSDHGAVPSYPTPEDAVRALAAATRYAQWRARPAGRVPELADVDTQRAQRFVADALAGGDHEVVVDAAGRRELLSCYGIVLWPALPADDVDAALAAAERLGYPVALKTGVAALRHRDDLRSVRLDLRHEDDVRAALRELRNSFGQEGTARVLVQHMAPPGVSVLVASAEDPSFGPVVSFGLAGVATELLDDRAYRIPPLTDVDAADLVRGVKASPLLFGYRGSTPADTPALEDLVARVSRLADDLPEVAELVLNPVVVAAEGVVVLDAVLRLAHPLGRTDEGIRRLLG